MLFTRVSDVVLIRASQTSLPRRCPVISQHRRFESHLSISLPIAQQETSVMAKTIVVVPCYNEAARLDPRSFREFAALHPEIQLLFVNDGSTDSTGQLLQSMASDSPSQLQLLNLELNGGKAEAVRQGVLLSLESEPDFFGYWDADLATPLDAIPFFRETLLRRTDIDVVIGSRLKLAGHRIDRRLIRRILGSVFATVASRALGRVIRDTQCGAKMFRCTDLTAGLFSVSFRSRWIFDVEILSRVAAQRAVKGMPENGGVYELPLDSWADVEGSKVRPTDFLRAAVELWGIYQSRSEWYEPVNQPEPLAPSTIPISKKITEGQYGERKSA